MRLYGNYIARQIVYLASIVVLFSCQSKSEGIRQSKRLDHGWVSVLADTIVEKYDDFQNPDYVVNGWDSVSVPHNWDQYYGYRRLMHGNKHGSAWYRRYFSVPQIKAGKRYFLFFEGVGSYASVWVNGKDVGQHSGGRTTFTLDVTDAIVEGDKNLLAVRADEPANIRDLPWVCGGCSPEWGFSEGSQPLGIFRPVHLVETSDIRVEPFGVHIWNDTTVTEQSAELFVDVEIKNYNRRERVIQIENRILDADDRFVASVQIDTILGSEKKIVLYSSLKDLQNPRLWSPDNPYLYKMQTRILESGKLLDEVVNAFGIRTIKWDRGEGGTGQFLINGKPVFINGVCEYEHLMGRSHSFSDQMIKARTEQVMAAGFNAFRDAHQPHNLRYNKVWDEAGILWWPQMSAQIWFDTPEFKKNFKTLLRDFIRERRNSPSIILWGLQNESRIPENFAREYTDVVREMDPTSPSQRLVVTCNGGSGTDWNVIQNWSGTYGGNPHIYDQDLSRQILNGEYGAWRSIDSHSEGPYVQDGPDTEDKMTLLMEMKMRLGKEAADSSSGHFMWLLASHENPGRTQGGEGLRDLDRVGPVNYKGLFTVWGEPLDAYYMYRSKNVDAHKEPMVYIDSHTWADRYTSPGIKSGIKVFSNCDEIELFNDIDALSLGRKKNPGYGYHFTWNNVDIQYNTLYAVGFVNGKPVAKDIIVFNHLPESPGLTSLKPETDKILSPLKGHHYLYRVNCGGDDFTDSYSNIWNADVQWKGDNSWGSLNWTDDFDNLPSFYASQRCTSDPVSGTAAWYLFQSFRYGMNRLRYRFPVPDGKYAVELYFIEPWYGTGGGMDCTGWRQFDVAINNKTVIKNLDIWKEAGHDHAFKKTIDADVTGGQLELSFPDVESGQAVISAIAISSLKEIAKEEIASGRSLIQNIKVSNDRFNATPGHWLRTGLKQYSDSEGCFCHLPSGLYGAEWLKTSKAAGNTESEDEFISFDVSQDSWVYLAIDSINNMPLVWMDATWHDTKHKLGSTVDGGKQFVVWRKSYTAGEKIKLGKNGKGDMYTVAVQKADGMDQAIDLRPTETYQAEDGAVFNGAGKVEKLGKKGVVLNGKGCTVEWTFSVGLASKYGLQFRYMTMAGKEMPVHMEIISDEGTLQWEGDVMFPGADYKWQSRKTDTRTTINAGTYKLRLTTTKPSAFYFDWLKVQ
jgi:beta-galactosidase